MENMKWVLKRNGWLLLGVPGRYAGEHDHPHDYWRFMRDGVMEMMKGLVDIRCEVQYDSPGHDKEDEIYTCGRKE